MNNMNNLSLIKKIKEDITILTGRIMRNLQALEDNEIKDQPKKIVCQNIPQSQLIKQIQQSQNQKDKKKQRIQNKQISQLQQDITIKNNKIYKPQMQSHKPIIKSNLPLGNDQQFSQPIESINKSQTIKEIHENSEKTMQSEEDEELQIDI